MKTIHLKLCGRWGNQLFQYAHAKALSEREGMELHVQPWVGQHVFENCQDPKPTNCEDVVLSGYFQAQKDLIYTRQDCLRWFKIRPVLLTLLNSLFVSEVAAHRRVGDYAAAGYPVISEWSYWNAINEFELPHDLHWVTEENQTNLSCEFTDFPYLPDFYRLMTARYLLRGNSCFSWWAAVLNPHQLIFSPVIDSLPGGVVSDCCYVPGNYPAISAMPGVTRLFLPDS